MNGVFKPATNLLAQSYSALVNQGLATRQLDGRYKITSLGEELLKGRKPGRKSKFPDAWQHLVDFYGGRKAFAELIPCHENTVRRWALHGTIPQERDLATVDMLSRKARLPNPFLEDA